MAVNDLAVIRDLLIAGFTQDSLKRLLLYATNPTIQGLVHEVSSTDSLAAAVDKIIIHSQKQDCLGDLLSEIKCANPAQYARFEASLSHLNLGLTQESRPQEQDKPIDPPTVQQISSVTIGDGSHIHRSTIAGRNVYETTVERLVVNVFKAEEEIAEQRHRRDVLELMKRLWITNTLEKSLATINWLEPVIEVRTEAVHSPWDAVVDTGSLTIGNIPQGTPIEDIFNNMHKSLLILGNPGSGKTLMLLKLAGQAIALAEKDVAEPIPIVFDLGQFTKRRRSLADWVLSAMNELYHLRVETIKSWLEREQLMLILDGLDRIQSNKQREEWVRAINKFHQEHSLVPLAVSCRITAYQVLKTQLQLSGAIYLKARHILP